MSNSATYLGAHGILLTVEDHGPAIAANRLLSLAELADCAAAATAYAGFMLKAKPLPAYFHFSVAGHYTLIDDRGTVAAVETRRSDNRWSANFGTDDGWVNREYLEREHNLPRAA